MAAGWGDEHGLHGFVSTESHFAPLMALLESEFEGAADAGERSAFGDEAGDTVLDDFGIASDIGDDGGATAEHGFGQREGFALTGRRHDEQLIFFPDDVDAIDVSAEVDAALKVEEGDEITEVVVIRAFAVELEFPVTRTPGVRGEGLEDEGLTFDSTFEASDHGHASFGAFGIRADGPVLELGRVVKGDALGQFETELTACDVQVAAGNEDAMASSVETRTYARIKVGMEAGILVVVLGDGEVGGVTGTEEVEEARGAGEVVGGGVTNNDDVGSESIDELPFGRGFGELVPDFFGGADKEAGMSDVAGAKMNLDTGSGKGLVFGCV